MQGELHVVYMGTLAASSDHNTSCLAGPSSKRRNDSLPNVYRHGSSLLENFDGYKLYVLSMLLVVTKYKYYINELAKQIENIKKLGEILTPFSFKISPCLCSIALSCMYTSGVSRKFPRVRPKFCHNHVTSQINYVESAEGTIILGWSRGMPWKTLAKLLRKLRIFVHSESKF